MAYGIKYQGSFESTSEETYTVYILEDGYVGSVIDLLLSAIPVKHSWSTDEAQPSIKGSSLTVSILNEGSLPITSFYSNNDNQFKVWFYRNTDKLFEGFLVQDDCTELMVDYTHEIILSFNDNLGLLKDVPFDQNVPDFGGYTATAYFDFVSVIPDNFIYLFNTNFVPAVGVPFAISGHIESAANATWTPIAVSDWGGGNYKVQVVDLAFIDMQAWPVIIAGTASFDLFTRNTLLNIIKICLYNTGLALDTHYYANIFEDSDDEDRVFLEQTFIDTGIFFDGENWKDCHAVLEYILGRFKLTLFQANGVWNIIRWQELRYYPTTKQIPYFIYNSAMEYTGTGTFDKFFTTGFEEVTYPENGLTRSILRPFKFNKETFNYKQLPTIINIDFNDLGTFDSTSASGGFTYDLYEFPATSKWVHWYTDDSKIVVKTETATGREDDRYILQPKVSPAGSGYDEFANVEFNYIQVSAGDTMDFQCRIKTDTSTGSNVNFRFGYYILESGGSYWTLNTVGVWIHIFVAIPIQSIGLTHTRLSADADDFFDYQLSTEIGFKPAFPVDGVLVIRVYGTNDINLAQPNVDCIWKDLSLTIEQNINDSAKIIGQVNNAEQDVVIKNNEPLELSIDDSPRNSIAGTLYKTATSGLVWQRTTDWYRVTAAPEAFRLGTITTMEEMTWRQIPRTKLEGTFYGLIQTNNISMLAILTNNALPGFNFIFGMLEIDYRNDSFTGTQYEIYEDGEQLVSHETIDYEFKYLYSK